MKLIILPRQARDKHRESTQKIDVRVFLSAAQGELEEPVYSPRMADIAGAREQVRVQSSNYAT